MSTHMKRNSLKLKLLSSLSFLILSILSCKSQIIEESVIENSSNLDHSNKTKIPRSTKENISIKLLNGETIKLSDYPKNESDTQVLASVKSHFFTLNESKSPLLWTSYNHGVAAGIDEDCIFIKHDDFYQQIYFSEGGTELRNDTLKFDFNPTTKYFHSCGACTVQSKFALFPEGKLLLKNDGLEYLPTDKSLNSKIEQNLYTVKKGRIKRVNDDGNDDGTRKLFCENLVLFYFNNNGKLEKARDLFYKYYLELDKYAIWEDITKMITKISKGFTLKRPIIPEGNSTATPTDPSNIYKLFKRYMIEKDLKSAQSLIHSEGVFYFDKGRISKQNFNKIVIKKASLFNTIVQNMQTGVLGVSDNWGMAAGGSPSDGYNPHVDFRYEENGGAFKKGSKILTITNYKFEVPSEQLIIEFFKDRDQWKIYSIYKWVRPSDEGD